MTPGPSRLETECLSGAACGLCFTRRTRELEPVPPIEYRLMFGPVTASEKRGYALGRYGNLHETTDWVSWMYANGATQ